MRLWGNRETEEEEPESLPSEEMAVDDGEEAEDEDPYDEQGNARWESVETGEPVDALGNPIPAQRVVAEVEEPEVPAVAQAPAMRSPFEEGLLSAEEQAELDALVDPRLQYLLSVRQQRLVERTIAADRQHALAARDLDLPDEYGARMQRVQHLVPAELRGTRKGAIVAAALAAAEEGMETGDIKNVFAKMAGSAQVAPPAPKPPVERKPLPPSAVSHTPTGNADMARPRAKKQEVVAGIPRDLLNQLNEERAARSRGRF